MYRKISVCAVLENARIRLFYKNTVHTSPRLAKSSDSSERDLRLETTDSNGKCLDGR